MTDKEKIRKEVERLRKLHQIKYQQLGTDNSMSLVECGKRNLCNELLSFIDSLQEEPESIWHDANQQPTMYRKYLVRYSDGRVSGSWERHDNGFIPWKDVVKEHGFTHWCYVEDLIKL